MGNPVVHFEILGKDAQALQTFYRQAFDWEIGPRISGAELPTYSMVYPHGGGGIDGGIGESPEGYPGYVTFHVEVPDVAAAFRKIEELGGKVLMGPHPVPGGPTIGLFADPEQHVIGLLQSS